MPHGLVYKRGTSGGGIQIDVHDIVSARVQTTLEEFTRENAI